MNIEFGKQISIEELKGAKIDLFLMAGNHEKRVFTLYNQVKNQSTIHLVKVLCYKAFECPSYQGEVDTQIVSKQDDIFSIFDSVFEKKTSNVSIFIDYSCMTKPWYYSIILYLANKQLAADNVSAYFGYTPSKYSPPRNPKHNTEIAPLPGKYIVPTDKPKALIVCLGYEQNKAEGIIEHLDPKISYIFYAKPALDKKFTEAVEKNNKSIIENNVNNVYNYAFDDLLGLERELTTLFYMLKDEYSVIIAPLGPKPFTLIAMLMAVKFPQIDIWRVGSGSDINEYPREPINDKYLITQTSWVKG